MPIFSTIKAASPADLQRLTRLWSDISRQEFSAYIGQENIDFFINSGELAEETERLLDNTFICERQGELAGFVVIIGDLIELLIVSPAYQNKLVGKQLYNFSSHKIYQQHSRIRVECFATNHRIRPILSRLGFQETGRYFDELGFETIALAKH